MENNKYLFVGDIMYVFELPNDEHVTYVNTHHDTPHFFTVDDKGQYRYYLLTRGKDLKGNLIDICPEKVCHMTCVLLSKCRPIYHRFRFTPQDLVLDPYSTPQEQCCQSDYINDTILRPITLLDIDICQHN